LFLTFAVVAWLKEILQIVPLEPNDPDGSGDD
jgi:hypothetical protein